MMLTISMLMVAALGAPPTAAEWAAVKVLSKPTYSWPAPDDWFDPAKPGTVDYTRITGAISVHGEFTTKAQVLTALTIAKLAETARGSPVKLAVLFLPWNTPVAPDSAAAHAEFYRTWTRWKVVQSALDASTYKPGIICLVDTETFDARNEPARLQVADLYSAFGAFLVAIARCERVEWYGWGPWPGPCEPDSWCTQKWAVPFPGLQSVGWEAYQYRELLGIREASRRARTLADSLGIATTTAWVIAPGAGQEFTFDATYQHIIWDIGPSTLYTAELARELYGLWQCGKPSRFMACPGAVVFWPSPFDPRIVDPDRKHLTEFLRRATE